MISKVRGTRDILDLTLYNFITQRIKKLLHLYNFTQIKTPILEHTALFKHSLGEHTDVVTKEMYIFEQGDESICLRPESTAPTMRAFLENTDRSIPWSAFSIGPMFRHERPQKGRWREFDQVNIEIIGTQDLHHDALFLSMLNRFFTLEMQLEPYILKINFLGTQHDRLSYKTKLLSFAEKHKNRLCSLCQTRINTNLLRILDCKKEQCRTIYKDAPLLTDNLSDQSAQEWKLLNETLDLLSVSRIHDPYLVRGLDYYEKTVFEFSSPLLGSQDAFCGGGRWNLSKQFDTPIDYPSLGCALGLGRLMLLLERDKEKLNLTQKQAVSVVLPVTEQQKQLAVLIFEELIKHQICADIILSDSSIGNMMKKANKMGAQFVLIIGPEEQENGTVIIKNMQSGSQQEVAHDKMVQTLIKK